MCAMGDGPFVKVINSVIRYVAPGRHVVAHNGRILGVISKSGPNGAEPTFVTIRDASFEWITNKKLQVGDNNQDMVNFYARALGRGQLFGPPVDSILKLATMRRVFNGTSS